MKLIDSGAECAWTFLSCSITLKSTAVGKCRSSITDFTTTANAKSFSEIAESWLGLESECGACKLMTNKIYEYIDENNWYIGERLAFRKAGYHFNDIPYRLLEHIDAE